MQGRHSLSVRAAVAEMKNILLDISDHIYYFMTAWSYHKLLSHMQDYTDNASQLIPPKEPISRKEREKKAREKDILRAARELFVSKGFRETTLDDIAHHAEFGKGTIYNYFASKEELFIGIVQHAIDEMLTIARDAMAAEGTTREKFLRYARELITYIRDSGELIYVVYHELRRADSTVNALRLQEIMSNARASWGALASPLVADMQSGALRNCDPMQLIVLLDRKSVV